MKHYCITCGAELKEDCLICPKCSHCSYFDAMNRGSNGVSGILSAQQIEANTQWLKYKCGPNGLCGHGYAAEDANAINDLFDGKDVIYSGRDNEKSGPDRIVDGQKIQTKYYKTANESVNAAFGEDGHYQYKDQVLEVPADQYEEAVKIMQKKIDEGKVEGVTNPNDAKKIVRKGTVTYRQAKNIAKAGNIDSLIFDTKVQTITALSAFGISFAINLGLLLLFRCKNKKDVKDAMQAAFLKGLENGTITLSSGILTLQVLRTQFGRNFAASLQWMSKNGVDYIYKTEVGKKIIHQMVKALFQKDIYGAAAKNAATRFFRTNAITNTSILVISSVPDVYHLIAGHISGQQFFKNLFVSGSSTSGTIGGGLIGARLGGQYAGLYGAAAGMMGGLFLGWASKRVADMIRKDDAELLLPLIQIAILKLSHDYMIQTEEEFGNCLRAIANNNVINSDLFHKMHKCDNDFERVDVAVKTMDYYFFAIIRQRKRVNLLGNQQLLLDSINTINIPKSQEFQLKATSVS